MMNDVLANCVDEQHGFLPYEPKSKLQFSRKGNP